MKIKILIVLLIPFIVKSQSWTFEEINSPFEGNYKIALASGTGTDFPYSTPKISIIKYKEDKAYLSLDKCGYFVEDGFTEITIYFDKSNEIFTTRFLDIYKDGRELLIGDLFFGNNRRELNFKDIMSFMKSSNKMYIRVSSKYSTNDLVFSLKGSAKAIEFIQMK